MNEKGFSLIELLMVIVVVGIIGAMVVPFIATTLDSWSFLITERDALFTARLALNRIIREIRQIKNIDSIETFTSSEFKFNDIDDNSINFKQVGVSLNRNSDELCNKLESEEGLFITYLDGNGNITSIKDDIRMVRVKLTVVSENSSITIQSAAAFRNIA
ncbi:MAG: type II secretion system protein [Candidatus Omnitrophota bacterium]